MKVVTVQLIVYLLHVKVIRCSLLNGYMSNMTCPLLSQHDHEVAEPSAMHIKQDCFDCSNLKLVRAGIHCNCRIIHTNLFLEEVHALHLLWNTFGFG